MQWPTAWLIVLPLLLGAAMAPVAMPPASMPPASMAPSTPGCWKIGTLLAQGLLDPHADEAARQRAARGLEKLATGGDVSARYVLGSLLRAGNMVPENPFDENLDRAATLLSNTIHDGYLLAMLKMAEIELERAQPLAANVWLQVYFTVSFEAGPGPDRSRGYEAGLLRRARLALRGTDHTQEDVVLHAGAFLDQHGVRIRTGLQIAAAKHRLAGLSVVSRAEVAGVKPYPRASGIAEYLVAVGPEGRPLEVRLFYTAPDAHVGRYLSRVARQMHYSELDPHASSPFACRAQDHTRYAIQPLAFEDGRYRLRQQAAD